MDNSIFKSFEEGLSKYLPSTISEILETKQDKNVYAIGFITTDDFYGFYITYEYASEKNSHDMLYEHYEWKNSCHPKPDYLYQPLVDVVEATENIDFTEKSDEKWDFGLALLTVLAKHIKQVPNEIFTKSKHNREDIVFFATMSDGDYMDEMFTESLKMFNNISTLEKYGIATQQ